jgi:hypothetical protein
MVENSIRVAGANVTTGSALPHQDAGSIWQFTAWTWQQGLSFDFRRGLVPTFKEE